MVLAEKPTISDDSHALDPTLLEELLLNIGTLASVYHKPPESFVSRARLAVARADDLEVPALGPTRGRARVAFEFYFLPPSVF